MCRNMIKVEALLLKLWKVHRCMHDKFVSKCCERVEMRNKGEREKKKKKKTGRGDRQGKERVRRRRARERKFDIHEAF